MEMATFSSSQLKLTESYLPTKVEDERTLPLSSSIITDSTEKCPFTN